MDVERVPCKLLWQSVGRAKYLCWSWDVGGVRGGACWTERPIISQRIVYISVKPIFRVSDEKRVFGSARNCPLVHRVGIVVGEARKICAGHDRVRLNSRWSTSSGGRVEAEWPASG